jgi:hypothetical protein
MVQFTWHKRSKNLIIFNHQFHLSVFMFKLLNIQELVWVSHEIEKFPLITVEGFDYSRGFIFYMHIQNRYFKILIYVKTKIY